MQLCLSAGSVGCFMYLSFTAVEEELHTGMVVLGSGKLN
jgi:hypothetical protein